MNKLHLLPMLGLLLFAGCSTSTVKKKINKAGDVAGQTVGEFAEGMAHGVQKAFETTVALSDSLKVQGIRQGRTTVSSDSAATDNLLMVYMIFEKDFDGAITAKAYDNKGLEMGRTKVAVAAKKDEAKYIDFRFDRRTNIDSDSKLTLE